MDCLCGGCFQALIGRVVCEVRALVVLPTKELAQQVRPPHNAGPPQCGESFVICCLQVCKVCVCVCVHSPGVQSVGV